MNHGPATQLLFWLGMTTAELDRLSYRIIQAAIEIHRALGPGLLESAYLTCMKYELRAREIGFISEFVVPVRYKGLVLDGGYRLDLLVEDAVVIELKAREVVLPIHRAQLLSYLRLLDKSLGLLCAFAALRRKFRFSGSRMALGCGPPI